MFAVIAAAMVAAVAAGCAVDEEPSSGGLVPGEPANITVFDPQVEWQVAPGALASKSRNTPYVGRVLRGRVRHTVYAGSPVVVDGVARR